jgi:hypothetical protein
MQAIPRSKILPPKHPAAPEQLRAAITEKIDLNLEHITALKITNSYKNYKI